MIEGRKVKVTENDDAREENEGGREEGKEGGERRGREKGNGGRIIEL